MTTSPPPPHFTKVTYVSHSLKNGGRLFVALEQQPWRPEPFSLSRNAARKLSEMLAQGLLELEAEADKKDNSQE